MNTRTLRALALPAALAVSFAALSGCSGLMNRAAAAAGGTSSGNVSSGSARLDVVNQGGQSIYSMQASACSDSNWGPDRLGTSTISSGGSMSFDLTPGCWDFRADFDSDHSSGNELVQRNIRIGSGSSWTWNIGG